MRTTGRLNRQQHRTKNKYNSTAAATAAAAAATVTTVSLLALTSSLVPLVASLSSSSSTRKARMSSKSTSSTTTSVPQKDRHPLAPLRDNFDPTWIQQLSAETHSNRLKSASYADGVDDDDTTNQSRRPVFNGHYVPVRPTPLKNPRLIIHSPDVSQNLLGLSEEDVLSTEFTNFFSGDVSTTFDGLNDEMAQTWATPYALSIMGTRYKNNCPYGTGDGYGDGRAISIGEVLNPVSGERWEMQLKGAGKTPFCRGADGRAVLRSSIREFLASEAMYNLNVQTTRGLSLIVSDPPNGDVSHRPWYSDRNQRTLPSLDDPRLARYTIEQRKQIIRALAAQTKSDPDVMIEEPNAIATRVAHSFVRVGHLDLFARRATAKKDSGGKFDTESNEWKELEQMVWHACFREYYDDAYAPFHSKQDISSAAKVLLQKSCTNIATMVTNWIRVGFAQGNFNADNCLVGGVTMDYGPFGFMDEYNPLFAKWTGSGEHFGFMNQPSAGYANYGVLVESVLPVICPDGDEKEYKELEEKIMKDAQEVFQRKMDETFRVKLGFHPDDEGGDEIWRDLEPLLRDCRADWTLFWRQLTQVANEYPIVGKSSMDEDEEKSEDDYELMLDLLIGNDEVREGSSPFYDPLSKDQRMRLVSWLEQWRTTLTSSQKKYEEGTNEDDNDTMITPGERMRRSNPKYTLREWMLVEAYTKASNGDETMIHELLNLVQNPYDEGTDEQEEKYYRRAPDEALKAGGTAYMS